MASVPKHPANIVRAKLKEVGVKLRRGEKNLIRVPTRLNWSSLNRLGKQLGAQPGGPMVSSLREYVKGLRLPASHNVSVLEHYAEAGKPASEYHIVFEPRGRGKK